MNERLHGWTNIDVAYSLTGLSYIARSQGKLREEKPDNWPMFNTQSVLSGILSKQKTIADAEPLLISAYEGMKQREAGISVTWRPRMKESLQRLVQLYEATGQSEKAAEWSEKLAQFDKAETEKKAAVARP